MIEAHGLGKLYHRGYFARRFGKRRGSDEFWALRDIDLELRQGDSLGIIGPNGAGKSTLLKILSRVTTPTEGWMTVRGRVGALIELGAGFHQELSGRDNVYIAGSILGMSRREIARRFEEIVEFAEIGEFIDMPVKKYSSGMFVRLGFAVAAHMDPDILLVDEVLAVGDGAFQKKCFGAMQRFREQGVSVILVSHSLYNIRRNCARGMVLDKGRECFAGGVEEAIAEYQAMAAAREGGEGAAAVDAAEQACSKEVRITGVRILDGAGDERREFDPGEAVQVAIGYRNQADAPSFHAEVVIRDLEGSILSVNSTYLEGQTVTPAPSAAGTVVCRFPSLPFTSGTYLLQVTVLDETTQVRYDLWQGVYREDLRFAMRPNRRSILMERWRGLVELPCAWESQAEVEAGSNG
jgi:lipopolysaccharide transport system ATP-binding protein